MNSLSSISDILYCGERERVSDKSLLRSTAQIVVEKMSDEGQTTTHSNIQVVCRFRPMNALEKQIDAREVVEINHDTCKLVVSGRSENMLEDHHQ